MSRYSAMTDRRPIDSTIQRFNESRIPMSYLELLKLAVARSHRRGDGAGGSRHRPNELARVRILLCRRCSRTRSSQSAQYSCCRRQRDAVSRDARDLAADVAVQNHLPCRSHFSRLSWRQGRLCFAKPRRISRDGSARNDRTDAARRQRRVAHDLHRTRIAPASRSTS